MRGDLSWVADSFRCRRCDGTIQEAGMDEVPRAFAITDIQSSPARYERSSVCQLCRKQHDLWK